MMKMWSGLGILPTKIPLFTVRVKRGVRLTTPAIGRTFSGLSGRPLVNGFGPA